MSPAASALAAPVRARRRATGVRFALVSGGTTALDVLGVVVGHRVLGLPLGLAVALAFAGSSALHFALHRVWVFAAQGCPRRQGVRYVAMVGGNLLVTALAVPALAHLGTDYRVAKLLVTALVGLANVAVLHHWVFPRPTAAAVVRIPAPRRAAVLTAS